MIHPLDNQPIPILKKIIDLSEGAKPELKQIAKAIRKEQNKIAACKREIALLMKQRREIWEKIKS